MHVPPAVLFGHGLVASRAQLDGNGIKAAVLDQPPDRFGAGARNVGGAQQSVFNAAAADVAHRLIAIKLFFFCVDEGPDMQMYGTATENAGTGQGAEQAARRIMVPASRRPATGAP